MADVDFLTQGTREFEVIDWEIEPSHASPEEEDPRGKSPWLPELRKRLETLMNLKPNWDGENGLPVSPECAREACAILDIASQYNVPKPHVSPTPDGGVAFEFAYERRELGLDIEDDLSLGFLREHEDGRYKEGDVGRDLFRSVARREIRWLLRGC